MLFEICGNICHSGGTNDQRCFLWSQRDLQPAMKEYKRLHHKYLIEKRQKKIIYIVPVHCDFSEPQTIN